MSEGRTVVLVLGSGGARGYAHIGVIEALEARGYRIVAISGSSMGAMVGGVWAAGRLPEYREWVTGLGQFEVLRLLDLALSSAGAIRGDKVFAKLHDLLGDADIEDLPVAYTAVATDLFARKEVWFQRGPLDLAMRASAAMPSLLPPVEWEGRTLVDGGVLNPLPLAPTASAHADLVIAVSLHGDGPRSAEREALQAVEPTLALVERVRSRASRLVDWEGRTSLWTRAGRDARAPVNDQSHGALPIDPTAAAGTATTPRATSGPGRLRVRKERATRSGLSKFDVVNLSIDTMQAALSHHRLAGNPPDLLVSVSKQACRTLDFHRAPEMITLGRQLTDRALDAYDAPSPGAAGDDSPEATTA